MKPLIATLSILTFATTRSVSNILNITAQKIILALILLQLKPNKILFILINLVKVTTSKKNLTVLDIKEIVQIGFYQNENEEIQAVKMPK